MIILTQLKKYRIANSPKAIKEQNEFKQREYQEQLQQYFATVRKLDISHEKASMVTFSKYKPEEVHRWLQNPRVHEKRIRNLIRFFYDTSPYFQQIIRLLGTMPTYAYVLNPLSTPNIINKEAYKKSYLKNLQEIEKMNLSHELSKASKIAYRDDVFYGYIHESKDSFFIQNLDANYCSLSSIEDGVFNFKFDFSYFDSNKDHLASFPDEFKIKYSHYQTTKEKWIELNSDNTICLKVNEEITEYPLPPFSSMFESIFDLDEYRKIKKNKTKMDNFLLLTQEIPMDEKNPELNKFLIDLDLAMEFNNMIAGALPDGVGIITSPMPIESVKLEKTKNDQDTLAQAQRDVYSDAGISQFLFNSDKNTSIGLGKSIINTEQMVFTFLRQIERWINRRLKKKSGSYKFKFKFLDQTVFNRDEVSDRLLKATQSSMATITDLGASLGVSPLELYNKAILENEVLDLHSMLKPLASTHTQSSDNEEKGRPQAKDNEISDSAQVVRDRGTEAAKTNG